MKQQDYNSHRRMVPWYHYFIGGITTATLIGSLVNIIKLPADNPAFYSSSLIFAISVILIFQFFFIRIFALRAQDRAIRAEENLRHYVLTGKLLDPSLKVAQIVALRFSSDAEFPALAEMAAKENLKSDDIKKSIKNWRPDNHRV